MRSRLENFVDGWEKGVLRLVQRSENLSEMGFFQSETCDDRHILCREMHDVIDSRIFAKGIYFMTPTSNRHSDITLYCHKRNLILTICTFCGHARDLIFKSCSTLAHRCLSAWFLLSWFRLNFAVSPSTQQSIWSSKFMRQTYTVQLHYVDLAFIK